MSHAVCAHCPLHHGAVYCLRTQCVYVRPDLIPTEHGRKVRGDDIDVFGRYCRNAAKGLRAVQVDAYIMMRTGLPLPANPPRDFKHFVDLLRYLDRLKREVS